MNEIPETHFYLGIGGMVMGIEPVTITTVLGSCVAITMYEPTRRVGAICHAALPKCKSAHTCHTDCRVAGKHVKCAVRVMLRQFDKMHISKKDIQIKIFGGANMFSQSNKKDPVFPIGRMNNDTARQVIQQAGHEIKAGDTGGKSRRKITFDLSSGKVLVERPGIHRPHSM